MDLFGKREYSQMPDTRRDPRGIDLRIRRLSR